MPANSGKNNRTRTMGTSPTDHIILKYFPELTERQLEQFDALDTLYRDWNAKINVISRKDIDNLYTHHVLHSLGIARAISFRPGTKVLDIGTGGGFPGIPLAILFPECHFHLIDSIGKKVRVAQAVADALKLGNVTTAHRNAVEEHGQYDFIVSRGVADLRELARLIKKNVEHRQLNSLPPGLLCLKGGNLEGELQPFRKQALTWNLSDFFEEDFFETKKLIYVQL